MVLLTSLNQKERMLVIGKGHSDPGQVEKQFQSQNQRQHLASAFFLAQQEASADVLDFQ